MLDRVSVIVVTRNEECRIGDCLKALSDFDDVWVVDSASEDATCAIARAHGAQVVNFVWNGAYPKKRQWCLDNLSGLRDFVFWVDADEMVTPELMREIAGLSGERCGYWVRGKYVYEGRLLRHGMENRKIALMDRRRRMFPVVDDLDLPMGEIEGHYQPVVKDGGEIGSLKNYLVHDAYDENWEGRHVRYAKWQAGVEKRGALPRDARLIKRVFMALPFKPWVAFVHCYILKAGFLDGARGLRFALSRARYYAMILNASRDLD